MCKSFFRRKKIKHEVSKIRPIISPGINTTSAGEFGIGNLSVRRGDNQVRYDKKTDQRREDNRKYAVENGLSKEFLTTADADVVADRIYFGKHEMFLCVLNIVESHHPFDLTPPSFDLLHLESRGRI